MSMRLQLVLVPWLFMGGLANGIIWRCSLDEANSCLNWYETEKPVVSISFDDEDGTTFYAGTNGGENGKWGNLRMLDKW